MDDQLRCELKLRKMLNGKMPKLKEKNPKLKKMLKKGNKSVFLRPFWGRAEDEGLLCNVCSN